MRSCSLYFRNCVRSSWKGLINPRLFGSRMASTTGPQDQKVEPAFVGFVPKGVDPVPPYFPPGFLLSVFGVCLLVRSGEYNFRAISGVDPFPSLVAPRIGFRV